MGKILTARVATYLEGLGCLSPRQAGFRRGRSTLATVARLQSYLARCQKTHLFSADIRRAFDLAEPRLALSYLQRVGVPTQLCEYFRAQLDGSTTQVMTAFGLTETVEVNRGTRQGGCESPLLFILLVDPLLHILEDALNGAYVTKQLDEVEPGAVRMQLADGTDVDVEHKGDSMFVSAWGSQDKINHIAWVGQLGSSDRAGVLIVNHGALLPPLPHHDLSKLGIILFMKLGDGKQQ
eukprot:gene7661-biopygen32516